MYRILTPVRKRMSDSVKQGQLKIWHRDVVLPMRSLIILCSYHHKNTEKVANVFTRVLGSNIKTPQQTRPEELQEYDLIGFGSGIYSSNVHKDLLDLAERLPEGTNGKAFLFSTSGAPALFDRYDASYRERYMRECHMRLREKLQSKGYAIMGEFGCAGFNTNGFLRLLGGVNRGRPDARDLERAEEFALSLKQGLKAR